MATFAENADYLRSTGSRLYWLARSDLAVVLQALDQAAAIEQGEREAIDRMIDAHLALSRFQSAAVPAASKPCSESLRRAMGRRASNVPNGLIDRSQP